MDPINLQILFSEGSDIAEQDWLRSAALSESFDFLRDPAEDIYSLADGVPLTW